MLVCDFIVEQLVRCGVDAFFVLTGGAIAPLIDAVARNPRASLYCFQHEQSASMAVDAYFRVAGRMACVAVTSGPGAQNVLNGLCGCYFDSVPALFITGQVNMRESLDFIRSKPRQVGFQETAVVASFAPYSKLCVKAVTAEEVPGRLLDALRAALAGRRGPSVIDLPVNVQMSEVVGEVVWGELLATAQLSSAVESAAAPSVVLPTRASSALAAASRPVIVIGQGARDSIGAVKALVERAGLPFVLTWAALDLFHHDHPLNMGHIGVYGSRVANFAVQNADLLLVLGARLDTRQTGGNLSKFSTQSVKIVCDIDGHEMDRLEERGVPIAQKYAMDVGAFLAEHLPLATLLLSSSTIGAWKETLRQWTASFGVEQRADFPGFVSPYALFEALNVSLPDDAIVVIDTGATLCWAYQALKVRGSQRVFSNLGNSSMGYALPAAIGAAIADPSRPVLCVIGDGGMQQNIQELVTARHYDLNIKVVVCNNSGYGIIKQFQNAYLGGRHAATSRADLYGAAGVDFAAVAAAYGVRGARVSAVADLALDFSGARRGLEVIDVIVHESQGIQPKLEFGNALENMSPFVDSAAAMVVPPAARVEVSGWVKL